MKLNSGVPLGQKLCRVSLINKLLLTEKIPLNKYRENVSIEFTEINKM